MLFEGNILRKKREKAKIEALFKASVKYNIKSNISKQKENSRHPSCMRMTVVLLFQYEAGRGVEHGTYLRVHIQDNMRGTQEDDWKPQEERIRMIVGASECASH